jgi:hypothetical protein
VPIDINVTMLVQGSISLVVALLGLVFHGIKKWFRGDAETITAWFTNNPKDTVASVFALLGSVATACFTNQLDSLTFTQLVMLSFPMGYSVDSLVNKGK